MSALTPELLREIARCHGTPVYVYDASIVRRQIGTLRAFDRVRYAQKACPNLHLLPLLRSEGALVDCVSVGELERVSEGSVQCSRRTERSLEGWHDSRGLQARGARGSVARVRATRMETRRRTRVACSGRAPGSSGRARTLAVGLFVAVLCFCVALPAQLVHLALAQHSVCAEHGELTHHGSPELAVGSPAAPLTGASDGVEQDSTSEHEHEHCACAAQGRERLGPAGDGGELTLLPGATSDTAETAALLVSSARVELYRLAPKTSPPA